MRYARDLLGLVFRRHSNRLNMGNGKKGRERLD